MNFRKFVLKIARVIIFMMTLRDKKSYENILIYDISFKTLIDPKPLRIRLFKTDEIIII